MHARVPKELRSSDLSLAHQGNASMSGAALLASDELLWPGESFPAVENGMGSTGGPVLPGHRSRKANAGQRAGTAHPGQQGLRKKRKAGWVGSAGLASKVPRHSARHKVCGVITSSTQNPHQVFNRP
jgi:hypothetical protein